MKIGGIGSFVCGLPCFFFENMSRLDDLLHAGMKSFKGCLSHVINAHYHVHVVAGCIRRVVVGGGAGWWIAVCREDNFPIFYFLL